MLWIDALGELLFSTHWVRNTFEADPTNDTSGRILWFQLVAERNANRKLHLIACTDVP